jgi:hypothetical protein
MMLRYAGGLRFCGLSTTGARDADAGEERSLLRDLLFPAAIFASWWVLYFS